MSSLTINPQPWARGLYKPARYKILYGGRGGGKSYEVADYLIIKAHTTQTIILCAREFQNSMRDSVHALISGRIEALGLSDWFEIQDKTIISKSTGTAFIFKGIRMNAQSIKSMFGIGICWVEEAQTISRDSWEILKPTIREEGSEIICTLNPLFETDPIYSDFIASETAGAWVRKVNWVDNIHFPKVLDDERLAALKKNPDTYHHIWEGELLKNTDAQIFKGKFSMAEFTPEGDWDGPYFGLDFGFAQDPTAGVKCWIHDDRLWIEHELYRKGLEIDDTAKLAIKQLPDCEHHFIRADNARPESISYLKRNGLPNIVPCEKGKGSVMDGIQFIRSFSEVVIHPRCKETHNEFIHYSYKTDRLSGDILPVPVDDHNHLIDGLRYSLEPIMKKKTLPFIEVHY
jgi:phage terminase large subunit